jgi:hypothetical protein
MKKITVEEIKDEIIRYYVATAQASYCESCNIEFSECEKFVYFNGIENDISSYSHLALSIVKSGNFHSAARQECFLNAETLEEICAAINACTISERYETFSDALEAEPEAALMSMTLVSVKSEQDLIIDDLKRLSAITGIPSSVLTGRNIKGL